MANKYRKLLEPSQIGSVRTRNRIIKSSAGTSFASPTDGFVNEQARGFYEALARGGVGLIIVEKAAIDFPQGTSGSRGYRIDDDKYIPGMKELTDIIHRSGCPAFIQILHLGPMHRTITSGLPPLAASALAKAEMPKPQYDVAHSLTAGEIEGLVEKFALAAVRLRQAGFDGIELNGGHSHLFNTFLSRAWNKRDDQYGPQTLENRARFMVQALKAIKDRAGKDFPVTVLINGAEIGLANGITIDETMAFAGIFQEAGADAIQVRAEVYLKADGLNLRDSVHIPELAFYPELQVRSGGESIDVSHHGLGAWLPLAESVKRVVKMPVIAIGKISLDLGERELEAGKVDFIGMNRQLLADPELPNKLAAGRYDDIAPCTGCTNCYSLAEFGHPVRCRVNAALGKEREFTLKPADHKKKVVVVGGGPAGMEAARVAALRGHEVILYEKSHRLGGLVPLAAMVKGLELEDLPTLIRYLKRQINKLGVDIRLGQEFTEYNAAEDKPDAVILAVGGDYNIPSVRGLDNRRVVNNQQLHRQLKSYLRYFSPGFLRSMTRFWMPVGRNVVIIGGQIHGVELAEYLVKRGRRVAIVDTAKTLADGIGEAVMRPSLLRWLGEKGVLMFTEVRYEEITDNGLTITTRDGERKTLPADTIITALPMIPNMKLEERLKGKVPEVMTIGDAREPHLIMDAIYDGACAGRTV